MPSKLYIYHFGFFAVVYVISVIGHIVDFWDIGIEDIYHDFLIAFAYVAVVSLATFIVITVPLWMLYKLLIMIKNKLTKASTPT